jgi:hypothetical protein
VTVTVHQTRYRRLAWHRMIGKCMPKLIQVPGSVRWPAWAVVHSQRYCTFISSVELHWLAAINKYCNMGSVTFRSLCVFLYLW